MAILLCHVVTVQDIQNNRPQVYALLRSVLNESHRDSAPRALHVLSLHSQLLSHFYFRYKLYVIFKKIPCVLQLRRTAFHTRYFIFYRSLSRSALYTPFSSFRWSAHKMLFKINWVPWWFLLSDSAELLQLYSADSS